MPSHALVATLVADPEVSSLSDAAIARAAQALPGFSGAQWLEPGVAADLLFEGDDSALARARAALGAALAGEPIDAIAQAVAGRRKKLLLADMDSTLIGQECIDELAARVGVGARVAAITERAMRGEIAFEPALRERVALLAGLPETVIAEVLDAAITVTPGAGALVATMRAHGAYAAIVSGGFTQFTGVLAARLGFDEHRANKLIVAAGLLAGGVAEPILGRDAKLAALRELRARRGLGAAETLAIGDGANDLAMLGEAGLGVAYRAKPAVAAAAHARIDHGDLTALLYAQGYARASFIDP
ncbi:MAG: phosphoserine phosphatase SerB [Roseiarcus sp.]|jgi:phosphoserine phosphatase